MKPDAAPSPGTEALEAVEEIARAMCDADGWNPDVEYHPGEPTRVNGGYIASSSPRPLWHKYAPLAAVALKTIQARALRVMAEVA